MAKLNISRLLESSKLLATKAGQELQELIGFVQDTTNQIVLALRQGLSFEDNFKCMSSTITLTHGVEQTVNSNSKQISYVLPMRTVSSTTALTSFVYYINGNNELAITAEFKGAPTTPQMVIIIIFFV